MNWITFYTEDLSTKEKRQVRQQIMLACQISKSSFYDYLEGKECRTLIKDKIVQIMADYKAIKKQPVQLIPQFSPFNTKSIYNVAACPL